MGAKKLKQIFEMAGYSWTWRTQQATHVVPFVGVVSFVIAWVDNQEDYFDIYLKPTRDSAYYGADKYKIIEQYIWRKNVKSLGHPLRAAVIKSYEDVVDLMEFCT
jgi:hypothetical protein